MNGAAGLRGHAQLVLITAVFEGIYTPQVYMCSSRPSLAT
jgi:hypothetical protein